MISALNQRVDLVEEHLAEELDVDRLAGSLGTTEYHLRRMFSSLAGMPLSEYVRRRRMTVARVTCWALPSGTDTARVRRSDARSGRSTAPAPVTYAAMEAPCVHNRCSGSA